MPPCMQEDLNQTASRAGIVDVHVMADEDSGSARCNVRTKLPGEACVVSLVRENVKRAVNQAYIACRIGSA